MARLTTAQDSTRQIAASASDYGSDLDDALVDNILSRAESQNVRPSIEQPQSVVTSIEASEEVATISSTEDPVLQDASPSIQRNVRFHNIGTRHDGSVRAPSVEIEYDERNRVAFSPARLPDPIAEEAARREASLAPEQPGDDTRTPLQRFRTAPKKPFSVTDFVSPAWCEQQYWYSLTKYGRVKQTSPMKQGSAVHKVLEEQVRKEVKVEVVSREDAFGLRVWNVIQGLRTLRATGMTRELEVWGFVDGELIVGVIDEVGTTCPDEEAEERMLLGEEASNGKAKDGKPLEANQRTLTSYLKTSQTASVLETWMASPSLHEKPPTFYITDVKTRQSKSLPADGSQSKPVYIQLMLYRRLLQAIAANEVEAEKVFARYTLYANATFSDTFLAEVSQLDFYPSSTADDVEEPEDNISAILAHNTLSSLWSLMISEFALTIPVPISRTPTMQKPLPPTISNLVTAQYRHASSDAGEGQVIGTKTFTYNSNMIEPYIADELSWWRGERATKGVDIEDAFKCRWCEFSENCSWRREKIEEVVQKARMSKERRKSEI